MSTTAPDTRTSIYSPVSPTTTFPAGFPVFDIDDISVYVDGVKRTDFNVTATFVEGISNDARAVFSPGVTGEVIIVGDREPRRQSRFGNGAPLPIWAQNLALDTLTAQVQESYRDIARAVLVPHGDTPPTLGAKGRELLASSTSAAAINALGGAGGLIVDAMIASLGAEKLTGTIDPARIPVLPNNVQVMSSGGIADLTILQQAQVVQGAIVTTTDGRRWVYLGAGDKLDEASYIALADITPEWSAISGKPAFGSAALDESGDFATAAQGVKADTALAALDTKFDKAGGTIAGSVAINGDLLTGDQVFLGATAGSTKLGGFRSGNNWVFAGNDGAGGYNWDAVLEWRAAEGSWNFGYRPTVQGVPLVNNVELATKFDKTGGTIAGSESAKISLDVATNPNTPTVRLENGNGRWDITEGISGNLVFLHYDTSGTFLGAPFYFGADGVPVFQTRPLLGVGGSGLATLAEVGSGSGVAGVSSFNGRTATVAPQSGDYNSTQITHAAETVSAALARAEVKTPWLTPEMFGLVGDGETDNSAAWATMMAAVSSDTGAMIIWPAKTYYFSSPITQTKTITHIGASSKVSSGRRGSVWLFGAAAHMIVLKQNGGSFRGISFRKSAAGQYLLLLPKSTETPTGTSGNYVYQSGTSYVDFEECLFHGPCSSAMVYMTNVLKWTFRYCKFHNTYTDSQCRCVWLDGSAYIGGKTSSNARAGDNVDNVEFANCMFSGESYATRTDGIQLDGKCDSTKFLQCVAVWLFYGIWLTNTGASDQVPNFTRWTQGGFENCYLNAIYCQYGDITTFSDMYASLDNGSTSISQYGITDVVRVATTYVGNVEFTACQMRGGKRNGYRLEGGRTQINGGQAGNNSVGDVNGWFSIDILSSVSKVSLNGVDCSPLPTGLNKQNTAIRNLKGASGIRINGCDFTGYTTAISGTSTGAGITGNLT